MLQQDIISPTRNYTGFLTATYDTDFFGNGQLYAELLVTRRKSQQNGQRQFTHRLSAIRATAPDYCDPTGYAVRQPARSSGSAGRTRARRSRVFRRLRHLRQPSDEDFVRSAGGFRGDLPFLSSWRYDFLRREELVGR